MLVDKTKFDHVNLLFVQFNEDEYKVSTLDLVKKSVANITYTTEYSEALELISNDSNKKVNLLLVDVYTQDNRSFELLKEIRVLRPKLLALIMTPFANNKLFRYISEIDKKNDYISEPLNIKQFNEALMENIKKMEEITIEEKLESLFYQYRQALKDTAQVLNIDTKGYIKYANKLFSETIGFTKSEIVGKHISLFLEDDAERKKYAKFKVALTNKKIYRDYITSKHKSGEVIHSQVVALPLFDIDGDILEYLCIINDISSLVKKSIEAKASEKAKDTFLATMSHEIRTPLNGIIGYARLMENMLLDTKSSRYLKIISQSAQQLFELINDILDFSKMQNGNLELNPQWNNLHENLEYVKNLFEHQAVEKNIRYEFNIDEKLPPLVYCDELRMRQVLFNLLSNAFKFTKTYVLFSVLVEKITQSEVTIKYSIKDDGIGIAQDKQEDIFNPFMQEKSSTASTYGGTGLGLSISSQIVSMMDSKIELHSEQRVGSEFSFVLKKRYSSATFNKKETRQKEEFSYKAKILVAEDNHINQMLITDILESLEINVTCVSNGQEALKEYTKQEYDLIFMDINMPIKDGIEATQEIRAYAKKHQKSEIPIVALTANVVVQNEEECYKAGMNAVLSKPFEMSDLHKILEHYLSDSVVKKRDEVALDEKSNSEDDATTLAKKLGISEDKIYVYIKKYITNLQKEHDGFAAHFNHESYKEIRALAHKLKGSSNMLGFKDVGEFFSKIEKADETDLLADKERILAELKTIIRRLEKKYG